MRLEDEVLGRKKVNQAKLLTYGFKKEGNGLIYETSILQASFLLIVSYKEKKINVQLIDTKTNEEYTNFRLKNMNGEFVSVVRGAVKDVLADIANKCFDKTYFGGEQANRLAKKISELYHVEPEFLWESEPSFGVFRHFDTKKWFGIIMNVAKEKITGQEGMVDILNVKLEPLKIPYLLKRKGYVKAYHMNKKYWLSIILDETLSDEEILTLLNDSYKLTSNKKRSLLK